MSATLSPSPVRPEPIAPPAPPAPARRHWLRWLLLALLVFVAANAGLSLLVQHTRLHNALERRLELAFGRPVEVGSFQFSLWSGPTLEARSVTVGEDPRFGKEYFLRAESLAARLRLSSLLAGRIELGTLSLNHPSLNLVHNPDGPWNLAEWLPKPGNPASAHGRSAPAIRRIEISSGRINFKQGDTKLPFSFINVNGFVSAGTPGQWQIDLQAGAARAALNVQQPGTLHLSGIIGGTSSRLRPAQLTLALQNASVSDFLRLTRNYDYGLRGSLAIFISAHTVGDLWLFDSRAQLRQLHRWDFPSRPDNPSLNLLAASSLDLGRSLLDVAQLSLEAPSSHARASASFHWNPSASSLDEPSTASLEISSAEIGFPDLLAVLRAFHSNIADDLTIAGSAQLRASFEHWPLRLQNASLSLSLTSLSSRSLRSPVHLSPVEIRFADASLRVSPARLSFGPSPRTARSLLSLNEAPRRSVTQPFAYRLSGSLADVRDFTSLASSLGFLSTSAWDVSGPVSADLLLAPSEHLWPFRAAGSIQLGNDSVGASLQPSFLNQPLTEVHARIDLAPGLRHVVLKSASAFGARWSGSIDRLDPSSPWQFSLSADQLSTTGLDAWLNPVHRSTLLDRFLPFLNTSNPAALAPDYLRASGRISIDSFSLRPFTLRRLQGDLTLDARKLTLAQAHADFYGGVLDASLTAEFKSVPQYEARVSFSRINLDSLTAPSPNLARLFDGVASADISFHTAGSARPALLASLECKGSARANPAQLKMLNLQQSFNDSTLVPGATSFQQASASFTCTNQSLEFQNLRLTDSFGSQFLVTGDIDFARNLDLRIRKLPPLPSSGLPAAPISESENPSFQLQGPLSSPSFEPLPLPKR
jgi:hypothetical protein